MRQVRRLFAFALALFMAFAVALPAFAQTVGNATDGPGSITINNAAKGEEYSVVKIFDAKLSGDNSGISYTYNGDIPDALAVYFEKDSTGNVVKKSTATDDDAIVAAVQAYAKTQAPTASATSDGSSLLFQGLPYGYYAVKSSQGTVVTLDSTNPNATINDKNTKDITVNKTVEKESYSIGEDVNYTATFDTVNFYSADDNGETAKQVIKYTITDTLPEFLSNVVIDSITITKKDGTTTDASITGKTFSNGSFDIEWADEVPNTSNPKLWTSKYDNGAKIIVQYHGTLTSVTNINTADTNTIKIQPTVVKDDGTPDDEKPWEDSWEKDATIKTYAAALKKTDENGSALAGAEFTFKGLTVTPGDAVGEYIVTSFDPNSNTDSVALATNDKGMLYIVGLANGVSLTGTETKAPNGYNKLNDPITLTPQLMTEAIYTESGTIYYDAKGNVVSQSTNAAKTETVDKNLTALDAQAVQVMNQKGTELPSTGGIGTTIFYVVGGIMVAGAAIFLLTKRRAAASE